MNAEVKAFRESLSLLLTRRFGTFWFASLLSNVGTWAQQVAEPWLLLSLGASSFLLGLDSFMMNAPVLLLTIAGGALADRADRRRVIAGFQSVQMLCPTLLVVLLPRGVRPTLDRHRLSLVVGITDALSMPSFQSIVPSIVEARADRSGARAQLDAVQPFADPRARARGRDHVDRGGDWVLRPERGVFRSVHRRGGVDSAPTHRASAGRRRSRSTRDVDRRARHSRRTGISSARS